MVQPAVFALHHKKDGKTLDLQRKITFERYPFFEFG